MCSFERQATIDLSVLPLSIRQEEAIRPHQREKNVKQIIRNWKQNLALFLFAWFPSRMCGSCSSNTGHKRVGEELGLLFPDQIDAIKAPFSKVQQAIAGSLKAGSVCFPKDGNDDRDSREKSRLSELRMSYVVIIY